jgi:hypothetical protein
MNLFQTGVFDLVSRQSFFKIECDALTDQDIETLTTMLWLCLKPQRYSHVYGVPTGGERIAKAFEKYLQHNAFRILVVDDVWTTGKSIGQFTTKLREESRLMPIDKAVLFVRGFTAPAYITRVFTLNERLQTL